MDRLFLSLKKRYLIPTVVVVSVIVWAVLCSKQYDSYWNGTIRRVQTMDFNILHHTLPVTLSYLVLTGQDEAVQRVLDCTYGIFGIVITDPNGKNIIYKTEKVYKSASWQKDLSVDTLNKSQINGTGNGSGTEHFDYLSDPPPLGSQFANDTPRVAADRQVGPIPSGRIIGRVYYVRQPPPAFWEDIFGALTGNWFEFSGSKRGYLLQTMNILAFGMVIILIILWRKEQIEARERELDLLEKELAIKRKALQTLTADLTAQRRRKEWLENEADKAYQRALRLKESLEKLKETFFFMDTTANAAGEAFLAQASAALSVRPPLHPPSAVIEEIESLLPELTNNAKILRSQAEVLNTYCVQLESRQAEMQQIIERSPGAGRSFNPEPVAAQYQPPLASEHPVP